MSDLILDTQDFDGAQTALVKFLAMPDIVVEIIVGADKRDVEETGQEVAGTRNDWKVVWVKNSQLLTIEQLSLYINNDENLGACFLGRNKQFCKTLTREEAIMPHKVERAFLSCGQQDDES